MKRFLVYIGVLAVSICALALLNDWIVLRLVRASTGNPIGKMERFWEMQQKDEIPILGSSRAQCNFVPALISPKCWNYGFDGMAMREVIFLMKELSNKDSDAPVIVNLDPWGFFDYEGMGFVGDYRLVPQSGQVDFWSALPGLRFYGSLRRSLADWLNQRRAVSKIMDNGAILVKAGRTEAEWAIIKANVKPRSFVWDKHGDRELQSALIALAPRSVVVVVAPCTERFMELYQNKDDFDRYLGRLNYIDNVTVVSCFGDSDFTYDDFTDNTHLTFAGARKFTRKFMNAASHILNTKDAR